MSGSFAAIGAAARAARRDGAPAAMLLYEHPLSSYAQKVKIALREKGLAFDLETPEALGTGIAAGPFGEANPRAEVPALVDGEARIFDSRDRPEPGGCYVRA